MSDWIENQNVIGGSTSKSVRVELVKTDGTAKTDAAYTDVTAYYYRPGDSAITSITMATLAAIDSAYSSGGWKHVSNGVYRFDVPDAAIAAITGGGKVLFTVSVSGCFPCNFELSIVSENSSTVKAAVTALNNVSAADVNAQCDTAISDAALATAANLATVDTVVDAIKVKTDNLPASPAAVGSAMALTSAYDAAKTAAQASDIPSASTVASAVWSAGTRSLTTFGTLVSDIWANASRTLTAISDSTGITTLLTRLASALTITNGKVDVNDKTGFGLASTERVKLDASQPDYAPAKASDVSGGGGGSVSGAYTVTLTVTDGTSPLQSARVRVGEGVTFETYVTDAAGQVQISRDAGTYRVAISKDGYSFDPVERTVTGDETGTITNDLEMTAVALPGPSDDASMCRVVGYFEDVNNQPVQNVAITFTLMSPSATKADRMIAGRKITARTDAEGRLAFGGNQYLDLQRNDQLTPAGTQYRVTSGALKLNALITLDASTFDLASVIS